MASHLRADDRVLHFRLFSLIPQATPPISAARTWWARTRDSLGQGRWLAWLPVLLFVLSLPAVTPRLYAADEIEYFAYLRSVWFDGDLSFDNEYRYFYDRGIARAWNFEATFLDTTTATGVRPNFAPVGSAILWAPIYVVVDFCVRVARWLGVAAQADGFSRPYLVAITYASALYGFLAVLLSVHAIRRVVGVGGWAAAIAVWLGTPLVFYMYAAPGFSHACSAFAVAAFFVAWLHVRESWSLRGVAALGALAALMGMVREQDLFIAVVPVVDYVASFARAARQDSSQAVALARRAVVGIVTFVVCYAPQVWAYIAINGRLGPSPIIQRKMTWTAPNAGSVLVSTENGLLFWTPLALLSLVGLALLVMRRSGGIDSPGRDATAWVGAMTLLMIASQVYVSGSLDTWAGAGSFGQRRFVGLTICLALGLAGLLRTIPRGRARGTVHVLAALCVWWNLALAVQFATKTMSRQRLQLSQNAYYAFIDLPRDIPSLVYRYFFDRGSFYDSSRPDASSDGM